jgi:hypothetical protein
LQRTQGAAEVDVGHAKTGKGKGKAKGGKGNKGGKGEGSSSAAAAAGASTVSSGVKLEDVSRWFCFFHLDSLDAATVVLFVHCGQLYAVP